MRLAGKFSEVRFVVQGAAAGSPPNVTAVAFASSGLRATVATAVTADDQRRGRLTRRNQYVASR